MKIKIFYKVLILLIIPAASFAQAAKVLKEPGLNKLNVFVGTWKSENTSKDAPPVSAVSTIQWSANKKYLIADQIVTNNGKISNNLSIYSYNPENDSYILSLVGIPGMEPFNIAIKYSGDTLIYVSSYTGANGKKTYFHTLNTFISPTYYTYQVQSSPDSIKWVTSMEGKSIKMP